MLGPSKENQMGSRMVLLVVTVLVLASCRVTAPPLWGPIPEYTRGTEPPGWSMSLISFNVWGVKLVAKDRDERMPHIGEAVLRRDVDVAVLQEAWLKKNREQIASVVSKPYQHNFEVPRTVGSGLFMLSDHPMTAPAFNEFLLNGRLTRIWEGEALAGKGVGSAQLDIRGLPVTLFNTHLIARHGDKYGPQDKWWVERQLQIFEVFKHIIEQTQSDAFIVAGDFNVNPFQREYSYFRRLTSLDGTRFQEEDPQFCTNCPDNVYTPNAKLGQIDYIFLSPRLGFKKVKRDFEEKVALSRSKVVNLSDHYGWKAEVEVTPDRPHPPPEQVRASTTTAVRELHILLRQYKKEHSSLYKEQEELEAKEDPNRGIEDRLCISCRINDGIRLTQEYLDALEGTSSDPRVQNLRVRLESYFQLFRR